MFKAYLFLTESGAGARRAVTLQIYTRIYQKYLRNSLIMLVRHSKLPCVWWMNGMAEEKGWLLVRESESRGKKKGVTLFDLMEEGKLQSGFPRPTQFSLFSSAAPYLPPSLLSQISPPPSLARQIDHPKRPSKGFSRNKQSSLIIIESANENFIHAVLPGLSAIQRLEDWADAA